MADIFKKVIQLGVICNGSSLCMNIQLATLLYILGMIVYKTFPNVKDNQLQVRWM